MHCHSVFHHDLFGHGRVHLYFRVHVRVYTCVFVDVLGTGHVGVRVRVRVRVRMFVSERVSQ